MNTEEKAALKALIKQACLQVVQQRCQNAETAMQQAQDSANNEQKSSAGDKYETSRAMGQADRDMNARQLHEAQKDLSFLNGIDSSVTHNTTSVGSVVALSGHLFFIAIGLGPVQAGDKTVVVISHRSPLFEQLKSKKAGDRVLFQGKEQTLNEVF